jgi:thiamine-monophosphate kinase
MKLSEEDRLLEKILIGLPVSDDLILGPGDDCAAVRMNGGVLLLKTDCIAEGVHFLREHDPARVGWKALCRPLRDIAAMGGEPRHALVTIFSPADLDPGYWVDFYRGIRKAARRFGVAIAGGEMSRQRSGIAVSVALTGVAPGGRFVCRSGGRPGDLLFVTGCLGGSIAGHHLDFVPRLREGRWLAETARASAMMDLSDGLGSDLPRLARASGCGFEVDLSSLPLRKGPGPDSTKSRRGGDAAHSGQSPSFSKTQGGADACPGLLDVAPSGLPFGRLSPLRYGSGLNLGPFGAGTRGALTDGEDYELLFAIPPRRAAALLKMWKAAFPRIPLTCIGNLNATGLAPRDWPGGWDHFSVVRTPRLGQRAHGSAKKIRGQ